MSSTSFDVIVIGAGIMGSCAAYYSSLHTPLRVLLLEKHDFLHSLGSSHGSSRTLRATYPEPFYTSLVLLSSSLWTSAQSSAGYNVLHPTSHLDFGSSDDPSLVSLVKNLSIPSTILENISDSSNIFSGVFNFPRGSTAIVTDVAGVIKPTKAVALFQSLALMHGAVLKDNTEVKDVRRGENGGVEVFTTSGEVFYGRKCVICAGAWMKKLVKCVSGVELPIQPVHTTICYWRIKEGHEEKLSIDGGFPTFASYGNPYIYGTPALEFPGMIKIALHGGCTCDPDKREWSLSCNDGSAVEIVKEWIREVMPDSIESEKPVMTQSCMYSMTPDGDFVIDFLGGEFGKDVIVGGGFSGHGFKFGPLVGKILSELAIDGEVSMEGVEMKYFSVQRFKNGGKGNLKDFGDQVNVSSSSSHGDAKDV